MKIRIEADTDQIMGTHVYVDGIKMSDTINKIVFVQQAGELPSIGLMRTKLDKDNKPYIDPATGDLARDVIAYPAHD